MKQTKGVFKKTIALTAITLAFLLVTVAIASAVSISAEKTNVIELETVKLTVTGVSDDIIWVNATPSSSHVLFGGGVEDTPPAADGKDNFAHVIGADGKRTYAVRFNDTGNYTIKVTVMAGPREGDYDTVDITVTEKAITFDVPATVVIGERFTIKGMANAGTYVTVAVDNYVYPELDQLVLDSIGRFSKEIDTSGLTAVGAAFQVPGSVRLKAYIDRPKATAYPEKIGPTETEDGSVAILMVHGNLTAELSTSSVVWGDDFTISGSAPGSKYVDIVIVSPKGSGGTMIDGTGKWVLCPGQPPVGIYWASTFVSEIDHNFSKKIFVGDDVDTGTYAIAVLSPGSDSLYGKVGWASLADALCAYSITAKTQDQLLAIIEDVVDPGLTDDLVFYLSIKVAATKGDFDGDGDVDFDDFVEFAGAYGTSEGDPTYTAVADFDNDGDVDFDDFVEFAGVYTG
jgi:hypothetical protein